VGFGDLVKLEDAGDLDREVVVDSRVGELTRRRFAALANSG
jgi:hypothetical protein